MSTIRVATRCRCTQFTTEIYRFMATRTSSSSSFITLGRRRQQTQIHFDVNWIKNWPASTWLHSTDPLTSGSSSSGVREEQLTRFGSSRPFRVCNIQGEGGGEGKREREFEKKKEKLSHFNPIASGKSKKFLESWTHSIQLFLLLHHSVYIR